MSEDKECSPTYDPPTIIAVGKEWLTYLREIDSSQAEIDLAGDIPYELQYTLEPLCEIVETEKIHAEHVALYYVVTHKILVTGRWGELISRVRDADAGPTYDKEMYRVYMENKLILLRRFFAFCWAQGYIGHDFLRWSWRAEDLVRLAKLTRTEPFLIDPSMK